ncbi:MAG: NAD-dependent epimerase/dehydratase family protein [Bacteroidia bacterium]|nr:NAD-dependent epimerase/dehydratase family protein [Bacteroidia bacterium]
MGYQTIVVTGATGFLGGRLVERLLVTPGVRRVVASGRNAATGAHLASLGAEFVPGDLTSPDMADRLVSGADAVVHCAARSSPWGAYEAFFQANVLATRYLLDAMARHQVRRLVHISTPSVYFNYQNRFDITEDEPLPATFVNAYAATKREAELEVLNRQAQDGLEAVIFRPRAIIGRGDTVIMPRILAAHKAGRLRIIGDGTTLTDVTCVSNLIDAILLGLDARGAALGQIYNITNGEPVNLWDLFREVFYLLDIPLSLRKAPYPVVMGLATLLEWQARYITHREPTLTRYGAGILACSMTHNIDKARDLLGYVPRQTHTDASREFAAWYQTQST